MSLTIEQKRDRFKPIVCRLLARRQTGPTSTIALSDEELSKASGLDLWWVKGLSWKRDWRGIPVEVADAFSRGCGIDFDDHVSLKRNWALYNEGSGTHLRRSPHWRTLFAPLVREALRLNSS